MRSAVREDGFFHFMAIGWQSATALQRNSEILREKDRGAQ